MKNIPIGISNFKELITERYYYIDKTEWMCDVLKDKVTLYTRPRRFGKTLNMSMLYYFFSNKEDGSIFDGLNITKHKEVMKHMNQYPVIFMTLKDMKSLNIQGQKEQFTSLIHDIIDRNEELLISDKVSAIKKKRLNALINDHLTDKQLENALYHISECLNEHYGNKAILLIDEYDVPLQSAYYNGYYDEMVAFIGGVFSTALKDNSYLQKGILTGCLRISRESIFTGLNNFKVNSIVDGTPSHVFGFTQGEIDKLLNDYELGECKEEVREWYDGYLFGKTEIYNPWSSIMYVDKKLVDPQESAISFWANTSSNQLVMDYIQKANDNMQNEFEALMEGKHITKRLKLELTYKEMDHQDNVYSFLLLTGYLKIKRKVESHVYELVIPNKEVYEIYQNNFMDYFKSYMKTRKSDFVSALIKKDISKAQDIMSEVLFKQISYFDNQESFYHDLLLGLLSDYQIQSNKEIGEGRPDIAVLPKRPSETAIVIECKQSKDYLELEKDSQLGAKQIIEKQYREGIKTYGYKKVVGYGISFYKKRCSLTLVD